MSHQYVSKRQNEVNRPQKSDMEIKTDQTLPYPKTGQILYPKYDESSIFILTYHILIGGYHKIG